MKNIAIVFIVLGLCGCATWVPKEEYRQLGIDTLEGKPGTLSKVNTNKQYEVYGESKGIGTLTTSGRQIRKNISYVKDFVDTCEQGVASAKILSEKPLSSTFDINDLESDLRSLKAEFKRDCSVGYDLRSMESSSGLDFSPYLSSYQVRFDRYVTPLDEKIKTNDRDHKAAHKKKMAAKEAYKKSPAHMKDQLCGYQAQINSAKKAIADENESAKHSGFVDKNKMHKAGRFIKVYGDMCKISPSLTTPISLSLTT